MNQNTLKGERKMTKQELELYFLNKIDTEEDFTEGDRSTLIDSFEIDRESISDHRWGETVESIVKLGERLFSIVWFEGATECQENMYDEDPTEVEEYTETIVVTRYREKTK